MRYFVFDDNVLDDFEFWSLNDLKTVKRIIALIASIRKNPFEGIGKPEPLKANLKGFWSRRINDEHRLVYKIDSEKIIIYSCRYHYDF